MFHNFKPTDQSTLLCSTSLTPPSSLDTMADPVANTELMRIDAAASKTTLARPGKLSGLQLYSRYAFAGAICCSVTHGVLTPVDVSVSTRCTSPLSLLTAMFLQDQDSNPT